MKAVVLDQNGDEEALRIDDVPAPEIRTGTLRIAVRAAGVNRADLLQRRGLYPPPSGASSILGLECAGTILDLARLLRERLTVIGSTLRSRNDDEKGRFIERFIDRFRGAIDQGTITPVVGRALPLAAVAEAHHLLARGRVFGKIVLTTDQGSAEKLPETLQ